RRPRRADRGARGVSRSALFGAGDVVSRTGLLPRKTFRLLLAAAALLSPLFFFRSVARHPLETIPCSTPAIDCRLRDASIGASVLGRAWNRFDEGRPWNRDERVFAPYPDSWALSEGFLLEAIVSYPWALLFRSIALGYDVATFLGCALSVAAAGALFA